MKKLELSYEPLDVTLTRKGKRKKDLREGAGISGTTLSKISKKEPLSLDVLIRIASYLECDIEDLVKFKEVMNFETSKLGKILKNRNMELTDLLHRCKLPKTVEDSIKVYGDMNVSSAKRIAEELGVDILDIIE